MGLLDGNTRRLKANSLLGMERREGERMMFTGTRSKPGSSLREWFFTVNPIMDPDVPVGMSSAPYPYITDVGNFINKFKVPGTDVGIFEGLGDRVEKFGRGETVSPAENLFAALDIPLSLGTLFGLPKTLVAKELRKYGKDVPVTHYSTQEKLKSIDPSMYASRPGASHTNMEYNRIAGNPDLYRSYAYLRREGNRPESMVGRHRSDFIARGMYDIDADPLGLKAKGKERATQMTQFGKYPHPPSQTSILNEIEREVKNAGFTGTFSDFSQQAQLFQKVDLVDIPERGSVGKQTISPRTVVTRTKQRGGYSVDPVTKQEPTEGYMVGAYPGRSEAIERPLTGNIVHDYMVRNRAQLENEKNFLGLWQDPGSGRTYLDVSRRMEPDQLREAMLLADKNKELAVWDIGAGQEKRSRMAWDSYVDSPEFQARLEEGRKVGKEYMQQHPNSTWWGNRGTEVEEVYGPELMDYWSGFTSATSPSEKLRPNVGKATEYMRRQIKGESLIQPDWRTQGDEIFFTGPGKMIGNEDTRKANILKVGERRFSEIQKKKVNEMFRAQQGDPTAGPMDRYYARAAENPDDLIFTGPRPGVLPDERYDTVHRAVEKGARRAGETFGQYSSEVWTGWREIAKRDGELFGIKLKSSDLGDSKGLADHFSDLLTEKAEKLGISRDELKRRVRSGDANLLSLLTGVGVAGILATMPGEVVHDDL